MRDLTNMFKIHVQNTLLTNTAEYTFFQVHVKYSNQIQQYTKIVIDYN